MSKSNPVTLDSLLSVSEQVIGLILMGKQSPTNFNPDRLYPTYQPILKDIQNGKSEPELVMKYSNLIQASKYAAKQVNGLGEELDWVALVNTNYSKEIIVETLEKAEKSLRYGDFDKFDTYLRQIVSTRNNTQRVRSVTADQVSDEYVPFMESGSAVWDKFIGGFPTMGCIIFGAKQFTGKTTASINLMDCFLRRYPEQEILFVTLEDLAEGWKERAKTILGERAERFWKRIRVMEFADGAESVIEEAGRHENVGLIIIDYIDYLVKGKDLESYETAYKVLSMGSKSLAAARPSRSMPILILAQFGKTLYKGGVPTPNAIPFSGDQFAYQIVLMYEPNNDFYSDTGENAYQLTAVPGHAFLVVWKVKNGARVVRERTGGFPGAIQTLWTSKAGLDMTYEEAKWIELTADTKTVVRKR